MLVQIPQSGSGHLAFRPGPQSSGTWPKGALSLAAPSISPAQLGLAAAQQILPCREQRHRAGAVQEHAAGVEGAATARQDAPGAVLQLAVLRTHERRGHFKRFCWSGGEYGETGPLAAVLEGMPAAGNA